MIFLVSFVLLPLCGAVYSDLWLATKLKQSEVHDILPAASQHDINNGEGAGLHLMLSCSSYGNAPSLKSYLIEKYSEDNIHPAYFSQSEDRVCYTHYGDDSIGDHDDFTTTLIPHALKIDDSVTELVKSFRSSCEEFVVEIAVGLGVQGKGLRDIRHNTISANIIDQIRQTANDKNSLSTLRSKFFWTSRSHGASSQISRHATLRARQEQYESALTLPQCSDFSSYTVRTLRSHISITSPQCSSASPPAAASTSTRPPLRSPSRTKDSAQCLLLLAAVSSLHPSVSHVTAHRPETSVGSRSDDYSIATPATDQNSWIQIGSRNISDGSSPTPYADAGLDGSNLVLGMIDSGIDDLSCYMIDSSGTPTTRTPADQVDNPVTEPERRK